ncbi:hypothetical protein C2845_PM15G06410 [Panicum miliaceum]|uniref:Uncharacterized protein n=1 Tax=Panicum miliaceum TaxID=4540 RepID=A0A3L6Q5G3_PANMI|nr:hypothetical protein C2845_PM15G06410 [Panicum miliaceum]
MSEVIRARSSWKGQDLRGSRICADILGLPNKGGEVKYELDVEAINFVHNKYGIVQGAAPKIEAIVERVKQNKVANEDFLRSWLMIVVSTFLCSPTSLGISPRCYPALVDLSSVKKLNWCKFIVDQLQVAAKKMGKKNSVRGCLFVHVILYVDSLAVDNVEISPTKPRVAAWTRKLLDEKKRRLSEAISKVLSGVTDLLGGFIQDIAAAEYEPEPIMRRLKRRRATNTHATADEE